MNGDDETVGARLLTMYAQAIATRHAPTIVKIGDEIVSLIDGGEELRAKVEALAEIARAGYHAGYLADDLHSMLAGTYDPRVEAGRLRLDAQQ